MFRRSFLTAASATLAGCGLTPSPPSTESYPESPPNVLLSFEWVAEAAAVDVTFVRGNHVTAANTAELLVRSAESDRTTVWVSREHDAASEYPLTPGATLRHSLGEPSGVRVVWAAPNGRKRSVLAAADRPTPTEREG
ncbi:MULTISPECIES: hypothetical protein [Haloarcula]|uniref:Uncharacterized protein n=1 Tax=Haloarcula pellucida TaxID=1427151 RepID=A0A830GNU0_9EURY|nr:MULTISPECIES: hypothetical protein [Halomicroarcula]MBX0348380.1 hypothetical protein [Halomicroarcula pellucida]MDS0278202.1 hypothetical protein [Halomicroarcula sp. S1AR25-4]GGN93636.1 hypothetical protein GCM10009030_19280 [Halomicroarcula pellucida]